SGPRLDGRDAGRRQRRRPGRPRPGGHPAVVRTSFEKHSRPPAPPGASTIPGLASRRTSLSLAFPVRWAIMTAWRVPFGTGEVTLEIPPGWRAALAVPADHPVLPDLDRAVADALDHPAAGPGLAELAGNAVESAAADWRRPRVVIAVTDATRECPDDRLVPP